MAKNVLSNARKSVSALVVMGWVAAVAGWLMPQKYLVAKVAMLSVARVLP
jgi:hypothetical protein